VASPPLRKTGVERPAARWWCAGAASIIAAMDFELIGYAAATLTTVSFVPQAIKTLRTRDTRAISLGMYLSFTAGIALWFCYGVLLESWPMIVANLITFVLAGSILVLKLRHG